MEKKINAAVENSVHRIWEYSRDNAYSLDSERHCGNIETIITETIVSEMRGIVVTDNNELITEREKANALRRKVKDLRERISGLEGVLETNGLSY